MENSEHDPGRLVFTVPEAAKELRVGRNKVYELVRTGGIPAVRLGRRVLIPREALRAWLLGQHEGHEPQGN